MCVVCKDVVERMKEDVLKQYWHRVVTAAKEEYGYCISVCIVCTCICVYVCVCVRPCVQ